MGWIFHLDLDGVLVDFLAGVCVEFKVDRTPRHRPLHGP